MKILQEMDTWYKWLKSKEFDSFLTLYDFFFALSEEEIDDIMG